MGNQLYLYKDFLHCVCFLFSSTDPLRYNSSQTKTWISEFLERCEIPEAGEILSRLDGLDYEGINGSSLYYWDVKKFKQFFGDCGDIMHRDFHFWVESKLTPVKQLKVTV